MELVDGLDVGEHLWEGVLREEVLRAVLLVHPEVKHLQNKVMFIRYILPCRLLYCISYTCQLIISV